MPESSRHLRLLAELGSCLPVKVGWNRFPELMSAKHMVEVGLSRPTSYQLLGREDMPVVVIGRRRFMSRDKFLAWLEAGGDGIER